MECRALQICSLAMECPGPSSPKVLISEIAARSLVWPWTQETNYSKAWVAGQVTEAKRSRIVAIDKFIVVSTTRAQKIGIFV